MLTPTAISTFKETGNIGFGTTAPAEKLDVSGGNEKMGWERIQAFCASSTGCTAICTAGKRATGVACQSNGAWPHVFAVSYDSPYACSTDAATDIYPVVYCANIH